MSQSTDLTISNQLMPNARTEINSIFGAIGSNHKGGSQPSYVLTGMTWIDDTSTPWAYNLYDGAGDITFMKFNPTADTVNLVSVVDVEAGGSAGVVIKNSGGTTVATLGSANTTNVTFAGTVNIDEIGTLTTQLSVTNGGTGLDALGTAGQMLQVNTGGTALEYGLVDTANIADDAVTIAKITSGAATDGQVLTADGAGGVAFEDAAGGWVDIVEEEITAPAAAVTFQNGVGGVVLDGTYDVYEFELINLSFSADGITYIRTGDAGGIDSGASDYSWGSNASQSGIGGAGSADAADAQIQLCAYANSGGAAGESLSGAVKLYQPAETTYFKKLTWEIVYTGVAGSADPSIGEVGRGSRIAAGAIDRLQFLRSTGNIIGGKIVLRGRKFK